MSLLWDFFNRYIVIFFETSVLKGVHIFLSYLHNNCGVLILRLSYKIKLSYTILMHTWKTFVADFFMIMFFTLFNLWLSTLFFMSFMWKTQNISESMFLHNTVELLSIAFLFTKDLYKRWVFYIKWERNYISKLHSMMKHILMSLFKEITERQKKKFSKRNRRNCRPT